MGKALLDQRCAGGFANPRLSRKIQSGDQAEAAHYPSLVWPLWPWEQDIGTRRNPIRFFRQVCRAEVLSSQISLRRQCVHEPLNIA